MALGFPHQGFLWMIQNFTLDTYQRMLENNPHCAFFVADIEVKYESSIIECIRYHFYYSRSFHNFRDSLEVIWALMFFYFLYSVFCRVTFTAGLGIEDHSDDPLDPCPDDECVSAGGVISLAGRSLLPAHVFCHGNVNVVAICFLSLVEHTSNHMTDFCV